MNDTVNIVIDAIIYIDFVTIICKIMYFSHFYPGFLDGIFITVNVELQAG